jgi:histidinol-phosphatase (PHP family)
VLDYHLHLWPHTERETPLSLEQLGDYCEAAQAAGVAEIAVTEHLFRFRQTDALLGGFWEQDEPDPALRHSVAEYWRFHAHADLDEYVGCVLEAKEAGLPVVLGLEVDHYPGRMDKVAALLSGYPFDVLLGSVHWIGGWLFDHLGDPAAIHEWSARRVDSCWDAYTANLEELAASGACDVLAHPDLIKLTGRVPDAPEEWWDRIAEAAASSGMAAEVSSAGWTKPIGEQYPAIPLLHRLVERGVPLTTASDAHGLSRVADRAPDLRRLLREAGVDTLQGYRGRRPHPVPVQAGRPEEPVSVRTGRSGGST